MKKIIFLALAIVPALLFAQYNPTKADINKVNGANLPTANVLDNQAALPFRQVPQHEFRSTFSAVRSSFNTLYWNTVRTGSGMTTTQASGNGLITTGTTANSETIIRSNEAFRGAMTLRAKVALSQRIINQNFFVELVDVIGDGLAITISSATAVTVTYPSGHGFTSENVGQFTYLGGYSGTGTFVPGRYAINAVSGDNVTYTVAGFAAGSGTCSVFGWNYHQISYSGTTATNSFYDAQREGWNSGTTTATINTTAGVGHVDILNIENGIALYADQLVASSTTKAITERASRVENMPSSNVNLYLQIRAVNGATAPASTTTMTLGFASIEDYVPIQTSITSTRPQSPQATSYTTVLGTTTVSVSGTPAVTLSGASNAVNATPVTYATNSTTTVNLNSAASTNATLVKASAGIIYTIQANNTTASAKYLRLYNLTTAPTVGTSTPVMVVTIPAASSVTVPIGSVGLKFATGISYAITNAAAYLDATAVAAGDVQLLINYQ